MTNSIEVRSHFDKKVWTIKMYSASNPVVLTIPQNGTQTKKEHISKLFPRNTVIILSVVQLACAILTAILQVCY